MGIYLRKGTRATLLGGALALALVIGGAVGWQIFDELSGERGDERADAPDPSRATEEVAVSKPPPSDTGAVETSVDTSAERAVAVEEPVATDPADTSPAETASTEPATTADPAPEDMQVAENAPETAPDPSAALGVDLVRRERDGQTLMAGRAPAGSVVSVLLDGAELAQAEVGGDGRFVAFLDLPDAPEPRILSLATGAGPERLMSRDEVILAPAQPPGALPETEGAAPPPTVAADVTTADTAPAAPEAPAAEPAASPPPEPSSAVLLASPEGIELLQPAAPETAPVPLALDTISYAADGGVSLSGRAQGEEGEIRIYLDNDPVSRTPVAAGRWRVRLPDDVGSGTYTLRVDRIDADGRVAQRIESPFLRETREALEARGPGEARVAAVTVQPGNTLWAIAREQYGEGVLYVRVFEANKGAIRNPDLIYPGQIFTIPD
ncbi:LysM peptidoglycan-binding domain-containing protein [Litorisediminicola beolgyonensis]|uniref:LysM peptidoglycan-binding domain-containing protein n=1 Tax=Litorisediminicola beolgyonensis TaxID=1173614 RepID=A0ABW3ZK00_9RHOB